MTRPLVILVNPPMAKPRGVRLPLSLLALGAVLEGRYDYRIVDGNVDPHVDETVLRLLSGIRHAWLGITVMPGPQVAPAIAIATTVRRVRPDVPIAWGGYFPTLYPDSAINAPYVDYVVRGQGEDTLLSLLEAHQDLAPADAGQNDSTREAAATAITGLTWKRDGQIVHNPARAFRSPDAYPVYPYGALENVDTYFRPSFLGRRTAVHQAAVGCRFRCEFCGVVSMFGGKTHLQGPERLDHVLKLLTTRYRADAVQYYDHNFFDREVTSIPILEVLARHRLPWWCYARADTLAGFSTATWDLLRASQLRMAYIGAEAASDDVLRAMRKGSRVEHTLAVAERCRVFGIIPEFSFVVGGPEDPEGEVERTFRFIKRLKRIHPACEVILYFYSPTPQLSGEQRQLDASGARIPILERYGPGGPLLPTTPEGWTDPNWIRYVCHQDAPWLTPALRERVRDFGRVLSCRFPTVQDWSTPRWGKWILRHLASWRYATDRYDRPRELEFARRLIPLREPQRESI